MRSKIFLVFFLFGMISHVISEDVTEQPQESQEPQQTQQPKCLGKRLADAYVSNAVNEVRTKK